MNRCDLHHLSGVHDRHTVRDGRHHTQVMRDEQHGHAVGCLEVVEQTQNLRLDRDVERGRRLVGEEQRRLAGDRHGDHHALAHAAGELVRMIVEAPRRGGDLDLLEDAQRLGVGRRGIEPAMDAQRFCDLEADGQDRVQGRHRFLEDHRGAVPADLFQARFVEPDDVLTIDIDPALRDTALRLRDQPHHGERGDALAASGLADQGERFVASDAQRQVAHGRMPLAAHAELDREIVDREDGAVGRGRVVPNAERRCGRHRGAT